LLSFLDVHPNGMRGVTAYLARRVADASTKAPEERPEPKPEPIMGLGEDY
jgi:hypothetical protein